MTDKWLEPESVNGMRPRRADEIAKLGHFGWYVDSHQCETTFGVVLRLTHGRFLAGCSDPWNTDVDKQHRVTRWAGVMTNCEVCADERKAAYRADELARVYAESCCADDELFMAEQLVEEAKERRELELSCLP